MAKYMIHACSKRMWYVTDYLIPSMLNQGISADDITTYLDYNSEGNLKSCIKSFNMLSETGGTWHLQDDIIISSNFKEVTENEDNGVRCGFCNIYSSDMKSGYVISKNMWYSFPCIRIPNYLAHKFVRWINSSKIQTKYAAYIADNKHDDMLFKTFMVSEYYGEVIKNICPNIVDNIDYLLGGSIINRERKNQDINSIYFNETHLISELERNIKIANLHR